jgi:hypothetical protein
MAVVDSKEDDFFHGERVCTVCQGSLHYPFLHWNDSLCICAECCREINQGPMADIIHLCAIDDIRRVGYRHYRLKRVPTEVTSGKK